MPKIKGAENLATIQRKILEERGLEKVKSDPTKKKQHSRLLTISVSSRDHLKTPTMRLLEIKFGEPIEFMLLRGSLSAVARKLAMIDKSTASKWIKKLNLRQQLP
ncbi:MAG: hypothetical protein KJ556_20220, partial [Gammaproteobacteria bacterium]|nr:hypothetical protein [Gammaproteobacteria bacterium]